MNCIFLYNPNSGRGEVHKKKDYIITRLKEKFEVVDFFSASSREEIVKLATDACGYYDTLIFSGGDGTANTIVNAVVKTGKSITLGYLPSGTCNDFACSLNVPKKLDKALNAILYGKVNVYDIFKINGNYGLYVCASGLFTSASYATRQDDKKKVGKLAYYICGFKDVFTHKSNQVQVVVDNEQTFVANSILTLLINSKSVAGYKLNKKVNLQDGEMEYLIIKNKPSKRITSFRALVVLSKLFLFGLESVKNSSIVLYGKFKSIKVDFLNNSEIINIDGEDGGVGDVDCEVVPNAIKIYSNIDSKI